MLALGAGGALLVAGWLLYFAALWIVGGCLFGAIGLGLGLLLIDWFAVPEPWSWVMVGLMAAVAGAIGIWAITTFHKMTFFVAGFFAGMALGWVTREAVADFGLEALHWVGTPAGGAVWCVSLAALAALTVTVIDWLLIAAGSALVGALIMTRGLELSSMQELGVLGGGFLVQVGLAVLIHRKRSVKEKEGEGEE